MAENRKRRPVKDKIEMGFDTDTIDLRIDQIISLKMVTEAARASRKFRQIVASIREVGIIEPPVVTPDKQNKGRYILLDGHLRIEALKQIGETDPPPINESGSGVNPGKLWTSCRRFIDGKEALYGGTDYRVSAAS